MEDKTTKDWRFWVFLVLSIIWSIRVFWLLIEDQYFSGFTGSMPLNEVGDFLAGSFSPLAFAWLAYGYWMQNIELKSNTEHSIKNAKAIENQFNYFKTKEENSFQPIFIVEIIDSFNISNLFEILISVKIKGPSIFDVDIIDDESISFISTLSEEDYAEFSVRIGKNEITEIDRKIEELLRSKKPYISDEILKIKPLKNLRVNYIDRTGSQKTARIRLSYSIGKFRISVLNAIKLQDFIDVD